MRGYNPPNQISRRGSYIPLSGIIVPETGRGGNPTGRGCLYVTPKDVYQPPPIQEMMQPVTKQQNLSVNNYGKERR